MERHVGLKRTGFKPPAERVADVTVIQGGAIVLPFPKQPPGTNPAALRLVDAILEDRAAPKRAPLKAVSGKRKRENRHRAAMVRDLYPERPQCGRPSCGNWADDLHEPLTRARGGSIVDPDNQVPLCRTCHDEVTFRPESELGWAYDAGLLVHSWGDEDPDGAA
jgi:hypothetical protein